MKTRANEEEDLRKYEEDLRHDCCCLGWDLTWVSI